MYFHDLLPGVIPVDYFPVEGVGNNVPGLLDDVDPSYAGLSSLQLGEEGPVLDVPA